MRTWQAYTYRIVIGGGELDLSSTTGILWAGHAGSQLMVSDSFGWSVIVSVQTEGWEAASKALEH